jgi:hypothetical protein
MNAVTFIEELLKEDANKKAADAFDEYKNKYPEINCTYGYFRTKFNNKLRELGGEIVVAPITATKLKPNLVTKTPKLSTRKITNYLENGELPEIPECIPTGTKFDELINDLFQTEKSDIYSYGGFVRKCVDIVAGKPGSGKTWSRCMLAVKAKLFAKEVFGKDIRVGFICAEMRESEWAKELNGSPLLIHLEVDYMLDYVGSENYEEIFWAAFGDYDICIVDSLPAILSHLKMSPNEKRNERELIFDFINRSLESVAKNNNNVQVINQANKDGSYKGGTEFPHMMSSMSYVKQENGQRFIEFEKNRNNGKTNYKKLYFNKTEEGDIEFNEELYRLTYEITEDSKTKLTDFLQSLNKNENKKENVDEIWDLPEEKSMFGPQLTLVDEFNKEENLEEELNEIKETGSFGKGNGLQMML